MLHIKNLCVRYARWCFYVRANLKLTDVIDKKTKLCDRGPARYRCVLSCFGSVTDLRTNNEIRKTVDNVNYILVQQK